MSRPRYAPLTLDPAGTRHLLVSDQPGAALPGAEPCDAATLPTCLADARMGLRLYAIGTEPFLWDVARIAAAAGLGEGEIRLEHRGSLRRRVQCVHCATFVEGVETSIVACTGCGVALFVRDHFSRALAAFQGVCVDAERPGDVPPAELLYP